MNPHEILQTAVRAGEILLRSGAETERVEDTILRISKAYGFKKIEVFVVPTGIFVSAENADDELITVVKRIESRSYHLGKIELVNNFSREIAEGHVSIFDSIEKLDEIENELGYKSHTRVLAAAVCCSFFTYIFGGNFYSCIGSFIVSCFVYSLLAFMSHKKIFTVLVNLIMGLFISVLTLSLKNIFSSVDLYFDKIVIGMVMPLVPGLGVTNAVRDIIGGNYLSGSSRLLDAVFVSVSVAAGVGVGIKLWIPIFGGI